MFRIVPPNLTATLMAMATGLVLAGCNIGSPGEVTEPLDVTAETFLGVWELPGDVDQNLRFDGAGFTGLIAGVFVGAESLDFETDDQGQLTGAVSGVMWFWDAGQDLWREGAFEGMLSTETEMSVNFDFDGSERFGVLVRNDTLAARGAGASMIAGTWLVGQAALFEYSDSGLFSGQDGAGCSYQGQYVVPDPATNIYAEVLDVSGCAAAGTAIGNSVIYRHENGSDRLLSFWWNPQDPGGPRFFLFARPQ